MNAEKLKLDIINEVLSETRIRKVSEPYTAINVMWDNIDKIDDRSELIEIGDRRWNTATSKYVKANYDRLVELTKKAKKRFWEPVTTGEHEEKDSNENTLFLSSKACSPENVNAYLPESLNTDLPKNVNEEIEEENINILPLGVCDCGYVIPELRHGTMFAQGRCPQCGANITSWDDGYRNIKVCRGWIRVGLWGANGGKKKIRLARTQATLF